MSRRPPARDRGAAGVKPIWLAVAAAGIGVAALVWLGREGKPPAAPPGPAIDAATSRPGLPPQRAAHPARDPVWTPAPFAEAPFAEVEAAPMPSHPLSRRAARDADAPPRPERAHRSTLFESPAEDRYDTADPAEVPIEGDFPPRGSVSFWLKPSWGGASQDDASFVSIAGGRLRIIKNVSFLRYEVSDGTADWSDGIGIRIADWPPDEWRYITATWDDRWISLYVDGVLFDQKDVGPLDLPPDATMVVGSQFAASRPIARGTIAGLTVLGRVLSPPAAGRAFLGARAPDAPPGAAP